MFGFADMLLLLVNIVACSTSDSDKEPAVAGVAHNRTCDEQPLSRLTLITPSNVEELSLDWQL
jgi:hypothetical protein